MDARACIDVPSVPASILDASALIAFLHDEPGADAVVEALAATAAMSVVNWAEALSKAAADGDDPQQVADSIRSDDAPLQLEPLTAADCVTAARLRPLTKARGLSLADRALPGARPTPRPSRPHRRSRVDEPRARRPCAAHQMRGTVLRLAWQAARPGATAPADAQDVVCPGDDR